ncbi:hypothetical protein BH24CHL1_BH24CHL1_10060 [soil metagenome]
MGAVLPGPPGVEQAVPVYHSRRTIPLANSVTAVSNVVDTLRHHQIPAYRLGNLRSSEAVDTLHSFNANILVCACFPHIVPRTITNIFPKRAINIHPSLLPDKRGPDPLFWTFQEDTGRSGVTIHKLSPRFDAGSILIQRPHAYADGTTENDLEEKLASLAVVMTIELLPRLLLDDVQPHQQNDSLATWAPWPQAADFRLSPSMSSRRAFNFVRGIQGRGVPISVEHQGIKRTVTEAITFVTHPENIETGATALTFADGYLIVRLQPRDD